MPWTCPIKRLWPSKFGLILERSDPATDSNEWQDDAGLDKDDPSAKYGHHHYLDHLSKLYFVKENASTRTILVTICSEGYFKVYFLFGDYFGDYFQFGNYFLNKYVVFKKVSK